MTPQENSGGGSRPVVRAGNRDAGKLEDRRLHQSTPASGDTISTATGLERVCGELCLSLAEQWSEGGNHSRQLPEGMVD